MLQRIIGFAGLAVLAMAVSAGPANAQQMRGGAGHFSGGHMGGGHVSTSHFGGAAPHATFVRPSNHFYGGARFAPANVNHGFYGSRYGYGYRYPNRGYGYWRNGVWIGLGLGYPYLYGSSYPYYAGYGYPYYYGSTYYPDYSSLAAPNVIAPDTTSAYPPAEAAPPPTPADSARITVQLPPGAQLSIDGQPTTQTGAVRTFETPGALQPGRSYTYRLVAQWVENGQTVTRERDVSFQAGGQAVVNMNVP
jgi:uncharacterized protein (TIGR03000 family)